MERAVRLPDDLGHELAKVLGPVYEACAIVIIEVKPIEGRSWFYDKIRKKNAVMKRVVTSANFRAEGEER